MCEPVERKPEKLRPSSLDPEVVESSQQTTDSDKCCSLVDSSLEMGGQSCIPEKVANDSTRIIWPYKWWECARGLHGV
jgi:hypothetical protein